MEWLQGLRVGSLCSGYGGLDMAVEQMGGRVVWQCENDRWARMVLRARWPKVKCFGDLKTTDWAKVAKADVVVAGFPCQPVSAAGLQQGVHDDRWLWPWIWEVARQVECSWLLLENVPGLLSANGGAAMGEVLGSLAERGWDAEWGCGGAWEVGACHRRERWWCVAAHPDQPRLARPKPTRRRYVPAGSDRADVVLLPTPTATYPSGSGDAYQERLRQLDGREPTFLSLDHVVDWGRYADAIDRAAQATGTPPPPPTIENRHGDPVLSPAFVEWMMMLPTGHVTELEQIARTNQLKILGNGVVPWQAVHNYNRLIERLHDEAT